MDEQRLQSEVKNLIEHFDKRRLSLSDAEKVLSATHELYEEKIILTLVKATKKGGKV